MSSSLGAELTPVPPLALAMVVPRFGKEIVGGAELLAQKLAERLAACGHSVDIYTTCASDHHSWHNDLPAGDERWGDVRIRRFPVEQRDPGMHGSLEHSIAMGEPLSREEEALWLRHGVWSIPLQEELAAQAERYDFVMALPYLFGTTYQAFEAARDRMLLIPCLHDEPYAYLGFVRQMLSEANGILFNAKPEEELARRLAPDLVPSTVVGMGFDPPDPVDEESFRTRYGIKDPYLLYVGRREGGKNVPLLTDYFVRYKRVRGGDLRLVFVGSGEAVRRHPDLIELKFDWKDRDALYRSAFAFCQPSVNESFSIVLMQAWLGERPAIVHGQCAVTRDHCERSNGGLWFTNYPEFEIVLDRLLEDASLRSALGANGRAFVEREYSWEAVLARFHAATADWATVRTASSGSSEAH